MSTPSFRGGLRFPSLHITYTITFTITRCFLLFRVGLFVIVMEIYLPIDYMIDGLIGAMTDQKVFEHIVLYKYP